MVGLKPSVNLFALLDSNDHGDKRLADFDAPKKDKANAKPQKPPLAAASDYKLKNPTPAAAAGGSKGKKATPAVVGSKAKTTRTEAAEVGSKPKTTTPAAPAVGSRTKNPTRPTAPAFGSRTKNSTPAAPAAGPKSAAAESMAMNKKQQPTALANPTQELFGKAYPSARELIFSQRKNNAAKANDSGFDGDKSATAQADNYKGQDGVRQGGNYNSAAPRRQQPSVAVNEAPAPAPSPPPPPSFNDMAQFPSLK